MYERVWDEADYVVPPAENGAFFVMTNVVITPNQTRSTCPEDPQEVSEAKCNTSDDCEAERVNIHTTYMNGHSMFQLCSQSRSSHWFGVMELRLEVVFLATEGKGSEFARSVLGVRSKWTNFLWPRTMDLLFQAWKTTRSVITVTMPRLHCIWKYPSFQVFIKNSISFSRFGDQYQRKNMREGKGSICVFQRGDPPQRLCPIFKLGDIVALAGGNITRFYSMETFSFFFFACLCKIQIQKS